MWLSMYSITQSDSLIVYILTLFIATYSCGCQLEPAEAPESSSGDIFNSCNFLICPFTKSDFMQVFGVNQNKNFNVHDLIGLIVSWALASIF